MGTIEIVILLLFLTLLVSFLGSISGVGGGVLYVPLLLVILTTYALEEIKFISTFLVFISATFNVILECFKKNINYIIIIFLTIVTILLILSEYVFKKKFK
ncbi:TSUP family transporter [Spiroplasma taiwanense]|uniref:Membrane transporter protein n=1 Tax=Spiroplasma taiwanense CT-1 TaxID=1276220 RepID=S5MC04_9MOLU|nr:TSUP family transporter [Spiroplasma taiwanense]AGR41263.1 hypothetical protein STAIW_v1c06450 [Spiroplasma taiwanense CT-1]